MIDVRRFAASALAAGLLALALAAPALAKEGAVVTFVEPFPRDAEPGATVTLTWDLTVPDAGGAPAPWGGTPVGVRLASPSGAVTEAMGVETAQRGRYAAEVVVPAGGIATVEAFIRGTANGVRSDLPITVSPDPLAAATDGAPPAGPTAPPASSSVVLVVGLVALAALAVAALTVLRRRGERTTKT
jgi:hypothetical protein